MPKVEDFVQGDPVVEDVDDDSDEDSDDEGPPDRESSCLSTETGALMDSEPAPVRGGGVCGQLNADSQSHEVC